jgi:hypothetical protein
LLSSGSSKADGEASQAGRSAGTGKSNPRTHNPLVQQKLAEGEEMRKRLIAKNNARPAAETDEVEISREVRGQEEQTSSVATGMEKPTVESAAEILARLDRVLSMMDHLPEDPSQPVDPAAPDRKTSAPASKFQPYAGYDPKKRAASLEPAASEAGSSESPSAKAKPDLEQAQKPESKVLASTNVKPDAQQVPQQAAELPASAMAKQDSEQVQKPRSDDTTLAKADTMFKTFDAFLNKAASDVERTPQRETKDDVRKAIPKETPIWKEPSGQDQSIAETPQAWAPPAGYVPKKSQPAQVKQPEIEEVKPSSPAEAKEEANAAGSKAERYVPSHKRGGGGRDVSFAAMDKSGGSADQAWTTPAGYIPSHQRGGEGANVARREPMAMDKGGAEMPWLEPSVRQQLARQGSAGYVPSHLRGVEGGDVGDTKRVQLDKTGRSADQAWTAPTGYVAKKSQPAQAIRLDKTSGYVPTKPQPANVNEPEIEPAAPSSAWAAEGAADAVANVGGSQPLETAQASKSNVSAETLSAGYVPSHQRGVGRGNVGDVKRVQLDKSSRGADQTALAGYVPSHQRGDGGRNTVGNMPVAMDKIGSSAGLHYVPTHQRGGENAASSKRVQLDKTGRSADQTWTSPEGYVPSHQRVFGGGDVGNTKRVQLDKTTSRNADQTWTVPAPKKSQPTQAIRLDKTSRSWTPPAGYVPKRPQPEIESAAQSSVMPAIEPASASVPDPVQASASAAQLAAPSKTLPEAQLRALAEKWGYDGFEPKSRRASEPSPAPVPQPVQAPAARSSAPSKKREPSAEELSALAEKWGYESSGPSKTLEIARAAEGIGDMVAILGGSKPSETAKASKSSDKKLTAPAGYVPKGSESASSSTSRATKAEDMFKLLDSFSGISVSDNTSSEDKEPPLNPKPTRVEVPESSAARKGSGKPWTPPAGYVPKKSPPSVQQMLEEAEEMKRSPVAKQEDVLSTPKKKEPTLDPKPTRREIEAPNPVVQQKLEEAEQMKRSLADRWTKSQEAKRNGIVTRSQAPESLADRWTRGQVAKKMDVVGALEDVTSAPEDAVSASADGVSAAAEKKEPALDPKPTRGEMQTVEETATNIKPNVGLTRGPQVTPQAKSWSPPAGYVPPKQPSLRSAESVPEGKESGPQGQEGQAAQAPAPYSLPAEQNPASPSKPKSTSRVSPRMQVVEKKAPILKSSLYRDLMQQRGRALTFEIFVFPFSGRGPSRGNRPPGTAMQRACRRVVRIPRTGVHEAGPSGQDHRVSHLGVPGRVS